MDTSLADQTASYEAKDDEYYGKARYDYVSALPASSTASILELGSGDGATGAYAIAQGKCARYVGIELFEPMAERARTQLSEVLVGNVETMPLPLAERSFDALIISEVLEHLIDPGATLARLRPFLKPGARVFASSPCLAHWRNIANLARGRFDYTDEGMMDRTHLRWFTPDSFRRMFEEAGYVVDAVRPLNTLGSKARFVRRLLGRRFDAIWYFQIDLRGHASLGSVASAPTG